MSEPGGASVGDVPRSLVRVYVGLFLGAAAVFIAASVVVAVAFPYHAWDAFAFGEVSRAVADGRYAIGDFGAAFIHRPLFYVLQGWVWAVFGFSFASGRLLAVLFLVLLVAAVVRLADAGTARLVGLAGAITGIVVLSVLQVGMHVASGLSDIPAAAMIAVTGAVALTTRGGRLWAPALIVLTVLTVLAKPSVLAPLVGLVVAVGIAPAGDRLTLDRGRLRQAGVPLIAGITIGLGLHLAAAMRLGIGLVDYLTTGSGGIWADRADEERWGALLRVDVLGEYLRLPVAFALVYALARVVGMRHRVAATGALVGAVVWTVVGGFLATTAVDQPRPLWTPEALFCWVGFFGLLAVFAAGSPAAALPRGRAAQLVLLAVPPLVAWWWFTAYHPRIASPAWPGLCVLVGLCLAGAITTLRRQAGIASLAPVAVLAVAFWGSLSALDGLHGDQWREVRSLGLSGLRDSDRTLNVVFPNFQAGVELIRPTMGMDGRLSTSEPMYSWWYPGRTATGYVTRCEDLSGFAAFILTTSDESVAALEEQGGSGDPGWWARCEHPRLTQLAEAGDAGFVAFSVER